MGVKNYVSGIKDACKDMGHGVAIGSELGYVTGNLAPGLMALTIDPAMGAVATTMGISAIASDIHRQTRQNGLYTSEMTQKRFSPSYYGAGLAAGIIAAIITALATRDMSVASQVVDYGVTPIAIGSLLGTAGVPLGGTVGQVGGALVGQVAQLGREAITATVKCVKTMANGTENENDIEQ